MTGKMPSVVSVTDLPVRTGSSYPPVYAKVVTGRSSAALGSPFDLTQFGVNIVTLDPGAWSSQRHWHETEDEFVYALTGEMVLIDDHGRHVLRPGQCAGFKAGNGNGHHIVNESDKPASFLVVGTKAQVDQVTYSDIDMKAEKNNGPWSFTKRDGSAF
jgi:uncharacterized cupin superfamily protein